MLCKKKVAGSLYPLNTNSPSVPMCTGVPRVRGGSYAEPERVRAHFPLVPTCPLHALHSHSGGPWSSWMPPWRPLACGVAGPPDGLVHHMDSWAPEGHPPGMAGLVTPPGHHSRSAVSLWPACPASSGNLSPPGPAEPAHQRLQPQSGLCSPAADGAGENSSLFFLLLKIFLNIYWIFSQFLLMLASGFSFLAWGGGEKALDSVLIFCLGWGGSCLKSEGRNWHSISEGGHPLVMGFSGPALRTGPWLGGTCVTLSMLLDLSFSFLTSEMR